MKNENMGVEDLYLSPEETKNTDGDGNIVRSIDISGKKEYNYEYEEGRIVRATEADIGLNGEIVTSKTVVNTVKYYYDSEGKMTKKVITFADSSTHTVYFENSDNNTVVKFDVPNTENKNKKQTITSHSKTDSFGRKVFDELQLGTGFVSRQFSYMPGAITDAHKENKKIKSTATTQLVSQISLSQTVVPFRMSTMMKKELLRLAIPLTVL